MTRARRGLKVKVKVKVMGQTNAVRPTSIEGSFFLVLEDYEWYKNE